MTTITQQFDAEALYQVLEAKVKDGLAQADNVAVIGIYLGGAWLAERLVGALQLNPGERLGFIDVWFYRDDFPEKGLRPDIKPTQIPFDVNDATILLVDCVSYTGRTTRAAINELFDYGRPAKIMLAALIDRGERDDQPVAADFVAQAVTLQSGQSPQLQGADDGGLALMVQSNA